MNPDDAVVSISALQHYIFCPRQCALIHIEQLWSENFFTAEGRVLHDRVDSGAKEKRGSVTTERSVNVFSDKLKLTGIADVVEFHENGRIIPVEYKRGKPKSDHADEIQLCAQALCLEEMLNIKIEEGALFYGKERRRQTVIFDRPLRDMTLETITKTRSMFKSGITPSAEYSSKCRSCSLYEICMPKLCGRKKSVRKYLQKIMELSE